MKPEEEDQADIEALQQAHTEDEPARLRNFLGPNIPHPYHEFEAALHCAISIWDQHGNQHPLEEPETDDR